MEFPLVIAIAFGIIAQSMEGGAIRKKCFSKICSSNPSNMMRVWDRFGSGAFGAPRCCEKDGTRWANKGIDIKCSAGSRVYAPFPARVLYSYRPFLKNRRPYNVAIRLQGTGAWKGYGVRLFFVKKRARNGRYVSAGTFIGYMTNMAPEYGYGMTNSIQVQVDKNGVTMNPTKFFC
ncbi:leukocyte cell-derived chemotaxin-2 [Pocillopora verrucosa]|uniref:leukocyte cell-derived chemotaxin-2 n=1 Tax=Pocillopora verrucosa TaxID=203993 RepID=UPI00333EE107